MIAEVRFVLSCSSSFNLLTVRRVLPHFRCPMLIHSIIYVFSTSPLFFATYLLVTTLSKDYRFGTLVSLRPRLEIA